MSDREQELKAVVDRFLAVHHEWGANSDIQFITEEYEQACDDLIFVFDEGDLPASMRPVHASVVQLAGHWQRYKDDSSGMPNASMPPQNFFKAIDNLVASRAEAEPRRRRHLESIEALTKQGVPDRQICDIYGWMDGRGNPQIWKLEEERAKPGAHVNADFVPPLELKDRRDAIERERIIAQARQRVTAKIENLTKPAPEPWEDLFGQDLSASQIAKMKRCSIEEVLAKARELNLPAPPIEYGDPRMTRAPQEPGLTQEQERSFAPQAAPSFDDEPDTDLDGLEGEGDPAEMTLDSEVLMYAQQGLKPKLIAEMVSTPDQIVSVQRVSAIIQAAEKAGVPAS